MSDPGAPIPGPPELFAEALTESFRRRRPQGSLRWNYEVAFALLQEDFGAGPPDPLSLTDQLSSPPDQLSPPGSPPEGQRRQPGMGARRAVERLGLGRLRSWVDGRAAGVAAATTERALREGLGRRGVSQTVEALRFLARRVEELEAAADRRRVPVLAPAALLAPPPVTPWVEPVADRLRVVPPSTGVLHAECGSGELVAALRGRGMTAFGAEPRGPIAWEAANRGVLVDIESAPDRLARVERGTLGGIVLSGVVDRSAVGDLVHLLATAVESLRPGGVLVVLSSDPEAPVAGWPAVARDLLPGRPLHADTWHLLLSRAGLQDLVPLAPSHPADGYALSARREP